MLKGLFRAYGFGSVTKRRVFFGLMGLFSAYGLGSVAERRFCFGLMGFFRAYGLGFGVQVLRVRVDS